QLSTQGVLRSVTLTDQKDAGYLPAKDPAMMTARDVIAAVRTFGAQGTLPGGERAEAIYLLIDQAEGQAMGPLSSVTLRDLAGGQDPPAPAPAPEIRNPVAPPTVA